MTDSPGDRPGDRSASDDLPALGPASTKVDPDPAAARNSALGRASAAAATVSLRLLLITAALLVVGYVLGELWFVILPLLLGLLFATVLWPGVKVLRGAGAPPALAASAALVFAILALAGLVTVLAPQVTGQAQDLADQVSGGLDDLQELLAEEPFDLDEEQIGGAVERLIDEAQANAQDVAGRVVDGVGVAGNALVELLLALVLTFFFLKDGPKFLPWFGGLVGPRAAPHVEVVAHRSWKVLGGFIRAQALVGLVDAVFIGIGLALLDIPLAVPLAVLVFFGAFIPIVGAVVTGALAALVALVTGGPTDALIVIAIVLVVQQLEGNILQPMIVGKTLDLHPGLVLLAVAAGGSLSGITGAFLAVPVVSVAAVVVRYVREALGDPRTVPGEHPVRDDPAPTAAGEESGTGGPAAPAAPAAAAAAADAPPLTAPVTGPVTAAGPAPGAPPGSAPA